MSVPHALRRPQGRTGVGPLEVFRAVNSHDQPLDQRPFAWVIQQAAYNQLMSHLGGNMPLHEAAAECHLAGNTYVAKIVTEYVYELVRQKVAPNAPSRLNAVFAFVDVYEAFSFLAVSSEASRVFAGEVPAGVPWAITPMGQFQVVYPATQDAVGFAGAISQALSEAALYWDPATPLGDRAEVLAGQVLMRLPELDLLRTMRTEGLLT